MSGKNGRSGPSPATSRRAQRRIEQQRQQKRRRLLLLGAGVCAAVLIVVAAILLSRPDDGPGDTAVIPPEAREGNIVQDGRTLGNPDAPVTIVQYADFQCPACAQFALSMEPQLVADFVETGQVRLVFHDFPFLDDRSSGNESDMASEAAFCAQDQGQFWSYHDVLFQNQARENSGGFARARLIEMARAIDLDLDQFTTCLDGRQFEAGVQALYNDAVAQGVNSTPTFDINGERVRGTNYQAIVEAIEAALRD